MKILLAEDHQQYAAFICRDLQETHGHSITFVADPNEAMGKLAAGEFDVVITDLIFDGAVLQFDQQQVQRPTLTGGLIYSGLAVAQAAQLAKVPVVIWTAPEQNRRLHLIFAHEVLGIRTFCSKSTPDGTRNLHRAALAAVAGQVAVDPAIQVFLPPRGAISLRQTILSEPEIKRVIWRAVALGAHSRAEISNLSGVAERTIGNNVANVFQDLVDFDRGFSRRRSSFEGRQKIADIVRYASHNRDFFLDETVRALFP